ncbi:MAG TPA: hypothetical protein PKE39_05460 [Ignavibacteria bacterium]|nr:hypothetical protein [Ignavibacteria bacterium]HMQ98450.1 hypothetical protein [Ignavibacteria bacterium]
MSHYMSSDFSIKQRYFLEPGFGLNGWVLRKEGSNCILKKAKYKLMLLYFAENMLNNQKAELRICDSNGLLEEIIDFENLSNT